MLMSMRMRIYALIRTSSTYCTVFLFVSLILWVGLRDFCNCFLSSGIPITSVQRLQGLLFLHIMMWLKNGLMSVKPRKWEEWIILGSTYQYLMAIVLLGFASHIINVYSDPQIIWPFHQVSTEVMVYNGNNCGILHDLVARENASSVASVTILDRSNLVINGTEAAMVLHHCCPYSVFVCNPIVPYAHACACGPDHDNIVCDLSLIHAGLEYRHCYSGSYCSIPWLLYNHWSSCVFCV
jgi:hypothetical protein